MLADFLIRAALAGIGVALAAGPLGCFIVWRRMAYFGDTLAHAALLGVALGFILGTSPTVGIFFTGLMVAMLLFLLQRQGSWSSDTLLGLLSHSALAFGMIAIFFLDSIRVDLMGYLFGDILAVSSTDLAWTYGGGAFVIAILFVIWRPLIALTVNEETAQAEGIPVVKVHFTFMVLIAVTVAIAMKIVGILLVTALLIIPAATARRFSKTPEQMAALSAFFGCFAVIAGLTLSYLIDTPAGPSIVAAAAGLFCFSLILARCIPRLDRA